MSQEIRCQTLRRRLAKAFRRARGPFVAAVALLLWSGLASAAPSVPPNMYIVSSLNSSTFGQSVTFTTTVEGGSGVATGTVQFSVDDLSVGGPVPLDSNGAASFTTADLSAGTHIISATYSGDAVYFPSRVALTQVVNPATPTVTTQATPTATLGQPVSDTATLTGVGPWSPRRHRDLHRLRPR